MSVLLTPILRLDRIFAGVGRVFGGAAAARVSAGAASGGLVVSGQVSCWRLQRLGQRQRLIVGKHLAKSLQ